jgi:hypothetical protein
MFPDVIEQFLDSLQIGEGASRNGKPLLSLSSGVGNQLPDGSFELQQPLRLFQKNEISKGYDQYSRKFYEEFGKTSHPLSKPICDALLCAAVFAGPDGKTRLAFLNDCLSHLRSFDTSHFVITSEHVHVPNFRHYSYVIGTLAWERLQSRCRRAQSDYHEVFKRHCQGNVNRLSLESPEFKRTVVDLMSLTLQRGWVKNSRWREIMLFYFESVAEMHFEMMWGDLDRRQSVDVALGITSVDAILFREKLSRDAQEVTIYLDAGGSRPGFVVPRLRSLVFMVSGMSKENNSTHSEQLSDSELGVAIADCAVHIQHAIRFLQAGRLRDAALYATIALERVFTRSIATTEAVSTRTALIAHRAKGMLIHDCQRELTELYKVRSDFVHKGREVSRIAAESILSYARLVLYAMTQLQRCPDNLSEGFLKEWVLRIDAIYKNLEARLPVDDQILATIGVLERPEGARL